MDVSFSENLKSSNINTWNKILNHRFIVEVAEDILPVSKFVFYLNQDKLFLRTFCDLLVTASIVAHNTEAKVLIENLIESTIRYEMPLQDELLHELNGENKLSAMFPIHESTSNYTTFLTEVSLSKDLDLIISAMAPCPWTYYEISNSLMRRNIKSNTFKKWLRFYSSDESRVQLYQIKKLLDDMGQKVDNEKKSQMRYYFSISCDYEMEFWNMVYSYSE